VWAKEGPLPDNSKRTFDTEVNMSNDDKNSAISEATASSIRDLAGRVARRLTVAFSGALGYTAAQAEEGWWQLLSVTLSVGLCLVAEHFSKVHDRKIVERAVNLAVEAANKAKV
jgi:hypothetical protein